MEKEPHRRFRNAGDMARELRRYADGFPIASRPLGPFGRALRWVRRRPWQASAIAATALLAIATPASLSFLSSWADAQIDSTMDTLLNDYRDKDDALAHLGWASRVAGDDYKRQLAEAFTNIRTNPERTIEILERVVSDGRDHPDARYLLAWAYARQTVSFGAAMWAEAERQIELGDASPVEPSAAGEFFRGQALFGVNPSEAVDSYEKAIRKRTNFTQAMLHQGRAMNQIMYSWRDITYYRKAVGRLEQLAMMQPTKAYPRYLLSLTHQLAAEVLAENGNAEQSREAYAASLAAARGAQIADSHSPRGYAAEAGYHESRGDFEAAIAAWNQLDNEAIVKSASDYSERSTYQMRLYFWLGDYANAERMRRMRFSDTSGYDREMHYDADESLYQALFLGCQGEIDDAHQVLDKARTTYQVDPEGRLILAAAYQLIGRDAPQELIPLNAATSEHLSPGWTPEWLQSIARFETGELDWPALENAAGPGSGESNDRDMRLTSAYFYRGVRDLCAGRRKEALKSLKLAANQRDNEHYCFRAKFLYMRMSLDPQWPSWSE
jgi:hypothetical protein